MKIKATAMVSLIFLTRPVMHIVDGACIDRLPGVVSWWPGDGNSYDVQGGNFAFPLNGASFAPGKVGQAFGLDGTNDYFSIPHNDILNPTGPFSVDAWVKADPVQLSPDHQFIIIDKSHGFNDATGWALQGNSDGTVSLFFGKGGASGDPSNFVGVSTTNSVLDDQWHHLAGVFTGSRFEIYLDGTLHNTNSYSGFPAANTREVAIGRSWGGGAPTRHFRGLIDEVEFFNRALTSNEVTAIFNVGSDGKCKPCTPPPVGLVSWWPGDGDMADITGTHGGSLENGTSFAPGKVGTAFSFDGIDDIVNVPDAPDLRFGPASPLSVDMWVYRTSSNPRQHLIGKRAGCTGSSNEGTFQLYLNTDTPEGLGFANPGGACACSGQDLPPLNTWTHLAGTFDGATLRLFINGQLAATASGSMGPSNSAPLLIGGAGACKEFGGLIDEVQIFDRGLSSNEISSIYSAGAVGNCKSCVVPISGLVAWWPADGNSNDIQNGTNGTLEGNTAYLPGAVREGFSLDGVTDAVSVGNPAALQLQNFTIDGWVRRMDTSQITRDSGNPSFPDGLLFSYGHFGYGFGLRQDGANSRRLFLTKVDMSDVSAANLQITDLNLHHVAVTKTGSTVVFYLDGVPSVAPAYDPGFSFTTTAAIGARGDDLRNSIYAVVDELKVYDRALTAPEIQAIVKAGALGNCKTATLRIVEISREGIDIRVTWNAFGGGTNQLQALNSLAGTNVSAQFTDVGTPIFISRTA